MVPIGTDLGLGNFCSELRMAKRKKRDSAVDVGWFEEAKDRASGAAGSKVPDAGVRGDQGSGSGTSSERDGSISFSPRAENASGRRKSAEVRSEA